MSLAVFERASLSYGKKTIVDELDLRIGVDDRIGLVGANGSGKTSLLRMLAGEQAPDGGRIRLRRGLRLGYLPQDIAIASDKSLLDFVVSSVEGREELTRLIAECEAELATLEAAVKSGERSQDDLMDVVERLSDLHERAAHYELHYTAHEATRILAGLGFEQTDLPRPLSELSGGWKMRAVLGALLFQKPDLLMLDEPTNHLDVPSVTWFGDFLRAHDRAFILICHDREFLNSQIARVVSFELEGVRQYAGDYEKYVLQRAEEEIVLENKAKNLAREREQAERFINRFRAQATKARAVQSRVKQLEKMETVEVFGSRRTMRFRFPPCDRTANDVMRVEGLAKHYGERHVLDEVSLSARRGEKVGIIGRNGAGKTTLLRMLAGELEPSGGKITLGYGVKCGYYAQHHAETLHPSDSVYDTVAREKADAGPTRVRSVLGAFLFSGDDVDKKINVLSGGERSRVALARLLVNPGNLLLMDEPTNHLDLDSSEALADSLTSYDGTLLFVSHNLSFVRRLATRIWNVDGGKVETFPGTLDEYMDTCRRRLSGELTREGEAGFGPGLRDKGQHKASAPQPDPRGDREAEKARKRKQAELRATRSAEKRLATEVERLEREIAELESAQAERSTQLADPEVYADKTRSQKLIDGFRDGQKLLESLQSRWERALTQLEAERANNARPD